MDLLEFEGLSFVLSSFYSPSLKLIQIFCLDACEKFESKFRNKY